MKHKRNVSCSSDEDETEKKKAWRKLVRMGRGTKGQETQRGNPSTTSTALCQSYKQLGYAKPMRKAALIFEELHKV